MPRERYSDRSRTRSRSRSNSSHHSFSSNDTYNSERERDRVNRRRSQERRRHRRLRSSDSESVRSVSPRRRSVNRTRESAAVSQGPSTSRQAGPSTVENGDSFPNRLPIQRLQGILSSFGVKNFNVKLVCTEKTFDCNLVMLQMASDVFLKMFETDMIEKRSRTVGISDVDTGMMELVIRFYEKDVVPALSELKHDAMQYIIEKYQFLDLKKAIGLKVVKEMRAQEALEKRRYIIGYLMEEERKAIANELGAFLAENDTYNEAIGILSEFEVIDVVEVVKGFRDVMSQKCSKSDCGRCRKRWKQMFRKCRSWIESDSVHRSEHFQTVFSLIDLTLFDLKFLQKELCDKSFVKDNDVFIDLTKKLITQLIRVNDVPNWKHPICKRCNQRVVCDECGHHLSIPFHEYMGCMGSHVCFGTSSRCNGRIRVQYMRVPYGGFPSFVSDSEDDTDFSTGSDN